VLGESPERTARQGSDRQATSPRCSPGPHPDADARSRVPRLTDDQAEAWEDQGPALWRAFCATNAIGYKWPQRDRRDVGAGRLGPAREWRPSSRFDGTSIVRAACLDSPFQLVEADRVCNPMQQILPDMLAGVRYDEMTARQAYNICSVHPGDRMQIAMVAPTWVRWHGSLPTGPSRRCWSWRRRRPDLMRGSPTSPGDRGHSASSELLELGAHGGSPQLVLARSSSPGSRTSIRTARRSPVPSRQYHGIDGRESGIESRISAREGAIAELNEARAFRPTNPMRRTRSSIRTGSRWCARSVSA